MDTFYRPSMRSHWNTQKRWAEGSEICTELMKGWYSPKQSQTNTDNLLRKNWTSTKSLLGHLHCSCLSSIISSIKICHNKTIFKTTRVIRTKLRSRISQQWLFLVLCHYCASKPKLNWKILCHGRPQSCRSKFIWLLFYFSANGAVPLIKHSDYIWN